EDREPPPPARVRLRGAEFYRSAEVERPRDVRAGLLANQVGETARQLALVRLGEGAKQHVGDHQAEHVIAEEFQALIAAAAARPGKRRNVRERALEQRLVGEAVADPLF